MDRQITYPGAIPLETDLANAQNGAMVNDGYLAEAVFGIGTRAYELNCLPTTPASMAVLIDRGLITQISSIDATAFGSLPASSAALIKLGINTTSTTLPLTAPSVNGQVINYLIQARFVEADEGPIALPYWNASSPATTWSGPQNSGLPQKTMRTQRVGLQAVAGIPGTVGSQSTPAATAGWVPLYVVTVAAGQTAIHTSDIAVHPAAPFTTFNLPALSANLVAAAAAYAVAPDPADPAVLTNILHGFVRASGGAGTQPGHTVYLGWDGADLIAQVDTTSFGAVALQSWVSQIHVQRFAGAGVYNWNCPLGVTFLDEIVVIGGGGGGSPCNTSTGAEGDKSGGGGGGGGVSISRGVPVIPGTPYTITVGGGGASGQPGNASIALSQTGFGGANSTFVTVQTSPGGHGGNATGGNYINLIGSWGSDGQSGTTILTGNGAPGYMGQGAGRAGSQGGVAGASPGAGGGGAYDLGTGTGGFYNGGAGADGAVIFTYRQG